MNDEGGPLSEATRLQRTAGGGRQKAGYAMRTYPGDSFVEDTDVITYKPWSPGEKNYEVVTVGDVRMFFDDPAQLSALALVAQEAEASLRTAKGEVRCDSCQRWTTEPLVEVHSHLYNDRAEICEDCAALSAERVA